MGMLNVVLVCAVQVMILTTGDCYTTSPHFPYKTEYKPGESVSVVCSGTKSADENLIVRFLKRGFSFDFQEYGFSPARNPDEGYPIVLAIDDVIESSIKTQATDKYTATGSQTATAFDYTYTINNLTTEDYGDYACGVQSGQLSNSTSCCAEVKVLGPITWMQIYYTGSGWTNENDGKITFQTTEDRPGKLFCLVRFSTSPIIEWDVTLNDTEETINVTDKFTPINPGRSVDLFGPFNDVSHSIEFVSDAQRFGYKDSGKTLKCTSKVKGYDEQTVETRLDITFPPFKLETSCAPGTPLPQASVGTKNFILLCYTRSNPEATVTWKANDAALREGITVRNMNKGPYLVSVLTIDTVQESDFTSYSFKATNELGSYTFSENGQGVAWQIKEGSGVIQAPDVETGNYPWNEEDDDEDKNPSKASVMFTSGTLLVLLAVSLILY